MGFEVVLGVAEPQINQSFVIICQIIYLCFISREQNKSNTVRLWQDF